MPLQQVAACDRPCWRVSKRSWRRSGPDRPCAGRQRQVPEEPVRHMLGEMARTGGRRGGKSGTGRPGAHGSSLRARGGRRSCIDAARGRQRRRREHREQSGYRAQPTGMVHGRLHRPPLRRGMKRDGSAAARTGTPDAVRQRPVSRALRDGAGSPTTSRSPVQLVKQGRAGSCEGGELEHQWPIGAVRKHPMGHWCSKAAPQEPPAASRTTSGAAV